MPTSRTADVRIGTAGWAVPRAVAFRFESAATHLERYSHLLRCTEINSSFHRPHAAATNAKWRDSTPPDFLFAVKMPRTITHERSYRTRETHLSRFWPTPRVTAWPRNEGRYSCSCRRRCRLKPQSDAISGRSANGLQGAYGLRAEARDVVLARGGVAIGSVRNLKSRGRSATGAGSNRSGGLAAHRAAPFFAVLGRLQRNRRLAPRVLDSDGDYVVRELAVLAPTDRVEHIGDHRGRHAATVGEGADRRGGVVRGTRDGLLPQPEFGCSHRIRTRETFNANPGEAVRYCTDVVVVA